MGEGGFNYESEWGERKELRPPDRVNVLYPPNNEVPYEVKINKTELVKYLNDEGVIKGKNVTIVMGFPVDDFEENILFGRANLAYDTTTRGRSESYVAYINLPKIYKSARFVSWMTSLKCEELYKQMVSVVLAHELEHFRQPGITDKMFKGLTKEDNEIVDSLYDTAHDFLPGIGIVERAINVATRLRQYYTQDEKGARAVSAINVRRVSNFVEVHPTNPLQPTIKTDTISSHIRTSLVGRGVLALRSHIRSFGQSRN